MAVCGWIAMVVSLSDRLYAIWSMRGMAKLRPGAAVWLNLPKRLRAEWVCHDDAARACADAGACSICHSSA